MFHFRSLPSGSEWSASVVVYGDMGAGNAISIPILVRDVHSDMYHAVIHAGDFAYNMNDVSTVLITKETWKRGLFLPND